MASGRKGMLEDVAVLRRSSITEDLGLNPRALESEGPGRAKKVTVSKANTIIISGAGAAETIEAR